MVVLTGINLNKRHQELNTKVNEAARNLVNFEEIKNTPETSDVDMLFKIDLASKYRNIDFILDTLKSGDNLYISRALSCGWIADDEFAQYMNPKYLEQNILQYLSKKMKKKVFASLSLRIRNAERAQEFYHYCMSNRMSNHGMNFLLHTKESFKIELLTLHLHMYANLGKNETYMEHLIGNSFVLAECYLKTLKQDAQKALHNLRYLYSTSSDAYLHLLEKYHPRYGFYVYSKKISESILKKHKERVVSNPFLYLNILRRNSVLTYSNSEDAKRYAIKFMPKGWKQFWFDRYYDSNKWFLELIPLGERFNFVKCIFTEKYPGQKFEDNYYFFIYNHYEMMTSGEKEEWALRQVATGEEAHGSGNDFIWYQFVNFSLALEDLKKYILIATESSKISKILDILVASAKSQNEITTLLGYYYDRHINEPIDNKICLLENIVKNHDVLNFNEVCWTAFEKLLYNLNVYHFSVDGQRRTFRNSVSQRQDRILNVYLVLSIKYYIIHQKPILKSFNDFIITSDAAVWRMRQGFDKKRDINNLDKIYQYLLSCFTAHMFKLFCKIKDADCKSELDHCIGKILELIAVFDKTFEDTSESIKTYVKLNFDDFKHHRIFNNLIEPLVPEFCMSDIMHYLKQDASLVVKEFPKIREYIQKTSKRSKKNINWLLKKLQIYFSHDLAPEYLNLLNECLNVKELHPQTARVAIFGIFNLSDEEHKIAFLKRYVPSESKIDHVNVCRNLLTIQTAICSEACHARPPLPLASFRDYIKGDYLQFCISIFDAYMANLTPAQCLSFVESLLDSPVSVQKHGLRLAFHYFSRENLKTLVMKVWQKTKNVSLRKVLYTAMFSKVNSYHDNLPAQFELFEVLKVMTKSLHQDDDEELFVLLGSRLPFPVLGSFLEVGYNVVKDFPKRLINFERLTRIIEAIEEQIENVSRSFVRDITEEHVTALLDPNPLYGEDMNHGYTKVTHAKWKLIKTSVIKHMDLHILNIVMDNALSNCQQKHLYTSFFNEFLNDLENLSFQENILNYSELNKVFLAIISKLESCVPSIQIYILVWQLRTSILVRQSLDECKPNQIYYARIAISKYASGIKDLIKEYIKKDMFLKSFHVEIKNIIEDGIQKIGRRFSKYCRDKELVHVLFCSALSECGNREIQIMNVNLLPKVYSGTIKEYYDVIDKLKSIDDKELQYLMNYRINCSDYRYRVYTN